MIILMGIAGSGKGTQGKLLAESCDLQYVSTGDILRAHATAEQQKRMLAGELLSDEEIIEMVTKVIAVSPDPNKILFDGFPRTTTQAEWLLEQAKTGQCTIEHVFHLLASREAVKARLVSRGRSDDYDEAIEERFHEYEKQTRPILDWLQDAGVPVIEVNAEQTVEAVNQDLMQHLQKA